MYSRVAIAFSVLLPIFEAFIVVTYAKGAYAVTPQIVYSPYGEYTIYGYTTAEKVLLYFSGVNYFFTGM